jgi:hypothetical protein
LTYIKLVSGPFFVEVFSGTGHLASAVRELGLDAFEFDITEQGGRNNLLHSKTLHELKALIAHPMCRGVWYGFPCGTFSSARRHDGGPMPLRGTNSKDIWGLPHLEGKERARVNSANKLLLRMHELMKHGENHRVPFYFENPRSSNVWMHPIIKQWVQHKFSHTVEFDYCQFGTDWRKPTTILSVGNEAFHIGKLVKCRQTWHGKDSICSKTDKPHTTLSGFLGGADKGQYLTNRACPYPKDFCTYVA